VDLDSVVFHMSARYRVVGVLEHSQMNDIIDDLDVPIWFAKGIAKEAHLFDDDGKPDARRAFYLLERGLLPGTKVGQRWVTTKRRLRSVFAGEAA